MRLIPKKQRDEMSKIPFFNVCAKSYLPGHKCQGRITWDHPIIFAGQQVIYPWATVSVCAYGHGVDEFQGGGDRNPEVQLWIALSRATDAELSLISKAVSYHREKTRLIAKYGVYNEARAILEYNARKAGSPIGTTDVSLPKRWYSIKPEVVSKLEECQAIFFKEVGSKHSIYEVIDMAVDTFHNDLVQNYKDNLTASKK